jgi:hypothetical protein
MIGLDDQSQSVFGWRDRPDSAWRHDAVLPAGKPRTLMSFGFIAAYAVLIALASVIEVPVGRGLPSVQLNLLIRLGSLVVAAAALFIVHGAAVPVGLPPWPILALGF